MDIKKRRDKLNHKISFNLGMDSECYQISMGYMNTGMVQLYETCEKYTLAHTHTY
jgi:hypothetical protein